MPFSTALVVVLAIYGAGVLCRLPFANQRQEDVKGSFRALERGVLGLALLSLALFALASLGGFRPAVLATAAAALAACGAATVAYEWLKPWRRLATVSLVRTVLAFLPLAFVLAIAVNPTVSWDGAVYHLTLPDLYLREGGFQVVPFLVYGVWPHSVELLFAVAMALDGYVAAKVLHFCFGLMVAATLFAVAGRSAEPHRNAADALRWPVGLVAAGLFLLNDVVLFEMRAAYVDLALAFFTLAAFLLLECWLDAPPHAPGSDRHLVLAGTACGLLAAAKITGFVLVACLFVLVVPRLFRGLRSNPASVRRWLLAFFLPAAVLWMPWLVRSWSVTGDPFYPLLHGALGGPDWSHRLGEQLASWQRAIGMGREPLDWLLLPWRVLTEGGQGYGRFDGRLTPLWLVFLPLAGWRAVSSPRARRALVVAALTFAVWAIGSQQMRLLVPALPLLSLAVADGLIGVGSTLQLRRVIRRRLVRRWLAWTALGLWFTAFAASHSRLLSAGWSHLRLYSDARFVRPDRPPRPPVFHAVSALPVDATVLLLNTNHLFLCRPTRCWGDSFFEASQISDWLSDAASAGEVARRLAARGISHLAWSGAPRGIGYPMPLLDILQRADLAQPVFTDEADRLWRLAPAEEFP